MNKAIPINPRRVVLVNPTKYLGNLLLAGGLIQAYAEYCQSRNIGLKIVIDESFRELCEASFPENSLIYFPRRKINKAGFLKKLSLYKDCLDQIRSFKADIAFNIEEDSATSHLTRLSGAGFKLGCSILRHTRGYDHIVPVRFEQREAESSHRWYSYYDVFAVLGMPQPAPGYLKLTLDDCPASLQKKLEQKGLLSGKTLIALHAGATKEYKRWPLGNMAILIEKILDAGLQPVLLGAGNDDENAYREINSLLNKRATRQSPVDLCNQLSLVELAQFLSKCALMIGNDSGPFHLGSALGLPGLVLFGPTYDAIWGPLGQKSDIVRGSFACDPACNKGHCLHEHRCMKEISPALVMQKIMDKIEV